SLNAGAHAGTFVAPGAGTSGGPHRIRRRISALPREGGPHGPSRNPCQPRPHGGIACPRRAARQVRSLDMPHARRLLFLLSLALVATPSFAQQPDTIVHTALAATASYARPPEPIGERALAFPGGYPSPPDAQSGARAMADAWLGDTPF